MGCIKAKWNDRTKGVTCNPSIAPFIFIFLLGKSSYSSSSFSKPFMWIAKCLFLPPLTEGGEPPCPASAWHFPLRRDFDEWGSVLGSPGRELALSALLLSVSKKRVTDHSGWEWKGSYNSFHELAQVRKKKKKKNCANLFGAYRSQPRFAGLACPSRVSFWMNYG